MDEDLEVLIAAEFKSIGYRAHTGDIGALADSLRAQAAEYGEIGIMAACIGYATAKGMRW